MTVVRWRLVGTLLLGACSPSVEEGAERAGSERNAPPSVVDSSAGHAGQPTGVHTDPAGAAGVPDLDSAPIAAGHHVEEESDPTLRERSSDPAVRRETEGPRR